MLSAVIPVAGLGTRSLPASKALPKEMLPVFDRPIVQYVVEEAVQSGVKNLVLVTAKGKQAIEDHFDVAPELEAHLAKTQKLDLLKEMQRLSSLVKVQSVRQKQALGLGHAVGMAKNMIAEDRFLVLLGDDMIVGDKIPGAQQLVEALSGKDPHTGAVLLMEVPESEVSKYGICEMDGDRVLRCVEKPQPGSVKSRLAIIGRYLLPRSIFNILEKVSPGQNGEIQLTDALNVLAKDGRLVGVVLQGQRFDAGDRMGFLEANLYYYLKSPMASQVRHLMQNYLSKEN